MYLEIKIFKTSYTVWNEKWNIIFYQSKILGVLATIRYEFVKAKPALEISHDSNRRYHTFGGIVVAGIKLILVYTMF